MTTREMDNEVCLIKGKNIQKPQWEVLGIGAGLSKYTTNLKSAKQFAD